MTEATLANETVESEHERGLVSRIARWASIPGTGVILAAFVVGLVSPAIETTTVLLTGAVLVTTLVMNVVVFELL